MTERSYYHNGCVAGDAVEAPYSAELYTKVESLLRSSGDSFVFPISLLSSLYGFVSAVGVIRILAGYAMVGGVFYYNSADVDLNIPANNSIYPRMDRVIIRVDWSAQTARLAIKTGRPALLPSPPELTQIPGELYEMSLYRYYLDAGATSTYTSGDDRSLYDERKMANTATNSNLYIPENACPNSEFMSRSERGALATATTATPAMWDFTGTPVVTETTKFDDMARGTCVEASVTSTDYILLDWVFATAATPIITIQMQVEVLSGVLQISDGATVLKYVQVTNGPAVIIIQKTAALGPSFSLRLSSPATCQFRLGQVTLVQGWAAAPFGTVHETLVFGNRRIIALAAGTGTFNISVSNPKGTQALVAGLYANDSLSSTNNTNYISIRDTLGTCDQVRVEIGRQPNFYGVVQYGIVGLVPSSLTDPDATLRISYNAVAVGTLTALLFEYGIIT